MDVVFRWLQHSRPKLSVFIRLFINVPGMDMNLSVRTINGSHGVLETAINWN